MNGQRCPPQTLAGLTLAIADDEAFNFYYPDNIALLERTGLKIVRFSPLHDTCLPDCQMIWLGAILSYMLRRWPVILQCLTNCGRRTSRVSRFMPSAGADVSRQFAGRQPGDTR